MTRKTVDMVDRYVGIRLKLRRLDMGFTQEKLAQVVNLTFQQIQKYESGLNQIPIQNLYKFSKLLNIRISYFFDSYELFSGCLDNIEDYEHKKNKSRFLADIINILDYYIKINSPENRKAMQDIILKSMDIDRKKHNV